MKERDTYDDPTTGSGDPTHGEGPKPEEPVTTGSGDPQHKRPPEDHKHGLSWQVAMKAAGE